MIPVIIFYLHVVFLTYVFTKKYIDEGLTSAFLSSIFIIIIFSVGWTISEFILSLFMNSEGISLLFPRAAFSLILLSCMEIIFYRFYYTSKSRQHALHNT